MRLASPSGVARSFMDGHVSPGDVTGGGAGYASGQEL